MSARGTIPVVERRRRSLTDRIDDWLDEHSPELVSLYLQLGVLAVLVGAWLLRRHLGSVLIGVWVVGGLGVGVEWYRRRHVARQEFRRRNGICLRCGYDLRATPERCPECGTVPEPLPAG
jgi:hypothetical protein